MQYREFPPHPQLQPYIDAYWTVVNKNEPGEVNRIFPDGCIDLIVNLGENFLTECGKVILQSENTYLVGTMTQYKETIDGPGTYLLGIRFKPAGFGHFFRYGSLHEVANGTVEFDKKLLPEIKPRNANIRECLDHFFLRILAPPRNSILHIVRSIDLRKGKISVEELSTTHFVTSRQLERLFREHIGLAPKKFISFVRYQFAMKRIQDNPNQKNLADIAFDYGYYDHSHLTKEIKKYSGILPSEV